MWRICIGTTNLLRSLDGRRNDVDLIPREAGIRRRRSRGVIELWTITATAILLAACSGVPGSTGQSAATIHTVAQVFPHQKGAEVITLQAPHAYTPQSVNGSTDDYHCTLVDPHLRQNSYIIGSHLYPNSPEVHHAITFEVLPADVPQALAANNNGKGWSCFGEAGVGQWLSVWAPGHGLDMAPKGTGFYFPKGSMVVMQVHYNLYAGDKPTHVQLKLQTVPAASSHLIPLDIDPIAAPPDIPCPAGVNGPLCNRAASLAELGNQWGALAVGFVDGLEQSCGRNPSNPPGGDTTTCTVPVGFTGKILRIQPHMHLLGTGMKVTLNPGTTHQRVLLDDTAYNFHYQRSFDMPTPVTVTPADHISVECTFDPTLEQELPQFRRLPPRYVTWGNGSANEMCLGIVTYIDSK
jgi:hypothetical protein